MASILPLQHLRQVLLCAAAIDFPTSTLAHEMPKPAVMASVASDSTAFDAAAEAVDAFHAALVAGDRDAALALLGEDIQIFEQGWVERSKAEYAAHHLASDIAFSATVASTQTARSGTVAGEMAYVSTEARMTGKFKGKDIDSISLETVVLRRIGGGWRVAHIHWSSRDAKK
jgi:ketosteroid isomerase-like protein